MTALSRLLQDEPVVTECSLAGRKEKGKKASPSTARRSAREEAADMVGPTLWRSALSIAVSSVTILSATSGLAMWRHSSTAVMPATRPPTSEADTRSARRAQGLASGLGGHTKDQHWVPLPLLRGCQEQ